MVSSHPLSPSRRAALGAAAALGLFARGAFAAGSELRVVTSDMGAVSRQILEVIGRRHPGYLSSANPRLLAQRPGPAIYVAVGPVALQSTLEAELGGAPLISTFVSNEVYTRYVGAVPKRPRVVTAIFAEASPINQMALIRSIYTRRVTVGVLLTESTANQEQLVQRAARANDLDIEVRLVGRYENVVRVLASLTSISVLLCVPDRDLYTADNLRGILESTYRRNQAVIGFSTSLVAAGTLAAAYSTIDDTIAQLEDVINALLTGRATPPTYPSYWRTAVNDTVARSLNLVVSDATRTLGEPSPPP